MSWIDDFDLFLFDFDGLLVNTEVLHYEAYRAMCADRGFVLPWDFPRYIVAAHYSAEGLEEQVYEELPELRAIEPNWKVLYEEKRLHLHRLIEEGAVPLMPGVENLLKELETAGKKRCVVTHSDKNAVSRVRKWNPPLDTIPFWVTRDDYKIPKPDPECYRRAIEMYGSEGDRVIGFEDTPRGLRALMGTRALPVMVSTIDYPELDEIKAQGVLHFTSFEEIPSNLVGDIR
jgi:HAD superfamily hydrolase (TIGR01509 family)